jgi:hypothetical protein
MTDRRSVMVVAIRILICYRLNWILMRDRRIYVYSNDRRYLIVAIAIAITVESFTVGFCSLVILMRTGYK